jgi:hypothetical protein
MSNSNDDLTARLRSSLNRGAAPELPTELVTGAAAHPAPRLTNPGRTLRVAGGAGLAVALITVGALVVAPTFNRAPLFTAAGASGDARTSASADTTAESMKIGWWVDYHYTAGSGLSTSAGNGEVYQLVLDGEAESRAAQIADVFGVDAPAAQASYSDDAWVVGPEDGTAPAVTVTWSGTGDWWYSDPTASSFWVCDASVPVDEVADYGCVLPENAPENQAPSEDEARAQAQSLLASTGLDVAANDITAYADDWGTSATANLVVDGVKTALDWTVSWSNTGEITYAYGHSVVAKSRGSYGTVSAVDAVDRLSDSRWWGSAGPDYQGGGVLYATDTARSSEETTPEVATEETTPEETPIPTEPTEEPAAPVDPAAPTEPAPTEEPLPAEEPVPSEEPTPEVVNVTIDTAEATLVLTWDADGNAWLVPGYAMQVEDGWWNSTVSLVEGVIALPEPMEIEPMVGIE